MISDVIGLVKPRKWRALP